jgi:PEGA domain
MRRMGLVGGVALALAGTGGCVERILTIQSRPSGALVYLNGQEMGRTPVQRDFTWYGTYAVTVRHEGYQTLKTQAAVIAPIYQWIPLDLITDLLPIRLKDHRVLTYDLEPLPPATEPSRELLMRAEQLRGQLQASHYPPATRRSTESGK